MESRESSSKLISVIIPVLDEAESLGQLADELRAVAETHHLPIEVIFVDDGSRDDSWQKILRLAADDARVNGIRFRRNFGKAAALAAGFEAASGEIVIQMDADLQDDPAEMPAFLKKLAAGSDVRLTETLAATEMGRNCFAIQLQTGELLHDLNAKMRPGLRCSTISLQTTPAGLF